MGFVLFEIGILGASRSRSLQIARLPLLTLEEVALSN